MIFGSKPLHELTDAEILAGIEELAAARGELVSDARARLARKEKIQKVTKTPRATVSNDILAMLEESDAE